MGRFGGALFGDFGELFGTLWEGFSVDLGRCSDGYLDMAGRTKTY